MFVNLPASEVEIYTTFSGQTVPETPASDTLSFFSGFPFPEVIDCFGKFSRAAPARGSEPGVLALA